MKTIILVIALAVTLGGCMHTVSFGTDSAAHWSVSPAAVENGPKY